MAKLATCGRKSSDATLLLLTAGDDELTITRSCHILPLTFPMLWPSATINYGGHGPQIASLWHQKCCGHRPQLTMATKGHKWPLCDLNLTKKWPIWRRTIIKKLLSSCGCGCCGAWLQRLSRSKMLHIFVLMYKFVASIKTHSKSQVYDNVLMMLYEQILKGWG